MSDDHKHDEHGYLTSRETTDLIYGYLQSGNMQAAVEWLSQQGDPATVGKLWTGVQCDINNLRHDEPASRKLALAGVEWCIKHGAKKAAANMLHNIEAFILPDFRRIPPPDEIQAALAAARRQVPLRRELADEAPYYWSLWDLGCAELIAGNFDNADAAFAESLTLAIIRDDRSAAAWIEVFQGKLKLLHRPKLKDDGHRQMAAAHAVIEEIGEDWEKKSFARIFESAALKL